MAMLNNQRVFISSLSIHQDFAIFQMAQSPSVAYEIPVEHRQMVRSTWPRDVRRKEVTAHFASHGTRLRYFKWAPWHRFHDISISYRL